MSTITSPDCRAGKCHVCSGDAWDFDRDAPTACEHRCHRPAPVDDPTFGDGKITVGGIPAEQRYSPVDGAPVPGTGACNVVRLEHSNAELLAQVDSLTTALSSANDTTEAVRAENENLIAQLGRARGLTRDEVLTGLRGTPAAYCPAGPETASS